MPQIGYVFVKELQLKAMPRVLHLLVVATSLLTIVSATDLHKPADPFELDDFIRNTFASKSWNGTWVSGDHFIYKNKDGDLLVNDLTRNQIQIIMKNTTLARYPGASVSMSNDETHLLIKHDISAVFRHSITALYTIYNIEEEKLFKIANHKPLQLAQWSPKGHGLVYVLDNNIYYTSMVGETIKPMQLTEDGLPGVLYNGVPDWVYEEEVLASGSALWFSPDAKYLAFASFNDSNVHEFDYIIYGEPGSLNDQYPTLRRIRYPKAGTPNPEVNIYIVDLEAPGPPKKITTLPEASPHADAIVFNFGWATNNAFSVVSTNRVQNQSTVVRCNVNGNCMKEAAYCSTNGWIKGRLPMYNEAGNAKVEILPQQEQDDHFDHLVYTDLQNKTVKRLSKGKFVVTSIFGWDETNNLLYYSRSQEHFPSKQHVYVTNIENNATRCLSCYLKTKFGKCQYATASFSKDLSRYVLICVGLGPYLVHLKKIDNENETRIWEDNRELVDRLFKKQQPVIKDVIVEIADDVKARARLFLPPNLDKTSKYPTIVYVYAGPGTNQIRDVYNAGFENYMTTNRRYIYVLIDGRGSGRDGQKKLFANYRRLGTVEVDDQIAVMKELQSCYSYIDANRTAIWGWSYGGFASAWALAKSDVFKIGLSVAPVTNFIYYDSIYTERYMGLPTVDDNLLAYQASDLTKVPEKFKNKQFMLIHGSSDDNVHYQQSMLLIKALEKADIPFQQQSYPDENHSLGHVRAHLYHTIDRFFDESFNKLTQHNNK